MGKITYLYRLYDKDKNLLYIGISNNYIRRFKQHRKDKKWFKYVQKYEVLKYNSRLKALQMEEKAIKKEKPYYNNQHNKKNDKTYTNVKANRWINTLSWFIGIGLIVYLIG